MNVLYLVNRSTTIRMKSNSIFALGSLDGNSFTIKSNNIKLHALSGTYNSYSSLYERCLPFLVY